jgi:uncharacterized integral membrane protein
MDRYPVTRRENNIMIIIIIVGVVIIIIIIIIIMETIPGKHSVDSLQKKKLY